MMPKKILTMFCHDPLVGATCSFTVVVLVRSNALNRDLARIHRTARGVTTGSDR